MAFPNRPVPRKKNVTGQATEAQMQTNRPSAPAKKVGPADTRQRISAVLRNGRRSAKPNLTR